MASGPTESLMPLTPGRAPGRRGRRRCAGARARSGATSTDALGAILRGSTLLARGSTRWIAGAGLACTFHQLGALRNQPRAPAVVVEEAQACDVLGVVGNRDFQHHAECV